MSFIKDQFKRRPSDLEKDQKKQKQEENQRVNLEELQNTVKLLLKDRLKDESLKSKRDITIGIQFLITEYLGLLDNVALPDNTKKAALLSILFKTEGEENIRQRFSNPYHKDTNSVIRKNLTFIINLFEKLGLTQKANIVKKDLAKII